MPRGITCVGQYIDQLHGLFQIAFQAVFTGDVVGVDILALLLSKSAVALRLTARPVLDIALQYRFYSQQTFTRAFKKQFAQIPALYRRSPE